MAAAAFARLAVLGPHDRVVQTRRAPMMLSDMIITRLIELVVHGDDLARSVPRPGPWPVDEHWWTAAPRRRARWQVITADGRLRGWIGGSCSEPIVRREALRALSEGAPQMVRIVPAPEVKQTRKRGELMVATTCPSGGALDIFIEPRLPKPLLLVFGDSPAAHTLVQMGSLAGFRTCSVHPGARPEDFAADIVLGSLDLVEAKVGSDTWAVVATMGHYDEDALEAALAHPEVEVALVASTRRAAAMREALSSRGLDARTLARIRTAAVKMRGVNQQEVALLPTSRQRLVEASVLAVERIGRHPLYRRGLDLAPELIGQQLHAVADAQNGLA